MIVELTLENRHVLRSMATRDHNSIRGVMFMSVLSCKFHES
jgi:hypothetical protein